jgi:hypothetical protein
MITDCSSASEAVSQLEPRAWIKGICPGRFTAPKYLRSMFANRVQIKYGVLS